MSAGGAVLVNLGPTLYLLNSPGSVALCDRKTPIAVPGKSAWQVSQAEAVDLSLLTGRRGASDQNPVV